MNKAKSHLFRLFLPALVCVSPATMCHGLDWSVNEVHFQYGVLDTPNFAGGGNSTHFIYTLQHASGWKYGDNFFFVDLLNARSPSFQNKDAYGEAYTSLSFSKISGKQLSAGFMADFGLLFGINLGADAKVRKYLSGFRLALNLPGFSFANIDVTAYIDDNKGVASGGAPKEENAFVVDFNFARPFTIGESQWSLQGHLEYIAARENEFGDRQPSWILFQPQLRWRASDRLSLGIEYQFWRNKLGDPLTDEQAIQALAVWTF